MPVLKRSLFRASAKPIQGKGSDRVIRFIASTQNVARDGGIVLARGWDTTNFEESHPSFLWAHNAEGLPLGRAISVGKTSDSLIIDVEFAGAEQSHPFAETVYRLFKAGFLKCVSVGFHVLEERAPTDEERERGAKWVATRAELLELSAVPVPSDPGAVATGREIRYAVQRGLIDRRTVDSVRHHLGAIDPWNEFAEVAEGVMNRMVEESDSAFILKVREADEFQEDSFDQTSYQSDPDVTAITGMLGEEIAIQGLAFPKDAGWDSESVESWWSENEQPVMDWRGEGGDEPEEEASDEVEHADDEDDTDEGHRSIRDVLDEMKALVSELSEIAARMEPEGDDESDDDEGKDNEARFEDAPTGRVDAAKRDASDAGSEQDLYGSLLDLTTRYAGESPNE